MTHKKQSVKVGCKLSKRNYPDLVDFVNL